MDMRNRQQSRRNKSTDTEEGDPRCLLCSYYDDFIACFSCPLRRLYCLFLISITATIAWFSSPLDLTIWTKSAFFRVKGGSNEFFTYLTVFRGVISFTYQKILLGDRVPLITYRLAAAVMNCAESAVILNPRWKYRCLLLSQPQLNLNTTST